MRRIASFVVIPRLIEDALNMPDGYEIVGSEWDWVSQAVRLIVEGPSLPEVDVMPNIIPIVKVTIGENGKLTHTWDFSKHEERGGK